MKKRSFVFLIIILLTSTAFLFASLTTKRVELDPSKETFQSKSDDEAQKGEYIVRLMPGPASTYGFEIIKRGKAIYLQRGNPFYITPEGFLNRSDAFTVGWWVVDKFKTTGRFPMHSDFNEILERELSIARRHNHQ